MSGAAIRAKQKQYETTIIDYLTVERGHIVALTDDQPFLSLLRTLLLKDLGLTNPFTSFSDTARLLRVVKSQLQMYSSLIVFMERVMEGQELSGMVRQFKEAYDNVRIIVLTNDVEKNQLMLLHEVGADNFVTKPVSANTLIEKIAFTLKPQSKLGELIDAAKAQVSVGNIKRALELSDQILEIKPNSAAGYLVRGDAYRASGELEKARDAYETASSHAELFMEPLRRLGDLHGEMGDLGGKLKYLERLDTLSPLNVERKVDMGEIHLDMGNDTLAEELFSTAVEQVTKDALNQISSIANRIASLYADKDPAMAEKFLRRSLDAKGKQLSREDLYTFNMLGINLRQQGRWEDAIAEYKKALTIAPDDENLYYNVAMAYAEGRDFHAARANMIKALEINANLPMTGANIAYNIGIVFMYAGGREQAEKCLRIALELKPDFTSAQKALEKLQ